MFVSPAYAQGGGGGFGGMESLIPLVLIFVVFYFLLIRPQQKRQKAHREMLSALRRGDRVVTSGGIVGQITRIIDDRYLTLEIAPDVKVRAVRGMISDVLAKSEPADDEDEVEDETEERDAAKSETKRSETKKAETKKSEARKG